MTERSAPSSSSAEPKEAKQMAKRAGTVAIFTLMSRILGYVRDAALANVFGAGLAFDAFIAAHTIPNVLRRLVAEGTLMIAYVPLLTDEKERGGLPAMRQFTAAVLGVLLPMLVVITSLGVLFPELAAKAFAPGFDAERAALAVDLTRVMMPFVFFISLVALAGGALNTQGYFAPTAAAPILLNICIIGAVFLFRGNFDEPIEAAAWGVFGGGMAQLLLQLPFLYKTGMLVRPKWNPRHPTVVLLAKRIAPAVFGVGVYQLNMMIIRQIASYMERGQLSCYFFANRLQEFALGVFAVSISVAALPTLSKHATNGDSQALWATFRRALRATNFVTVPSMVGLLVLSEPIVGVLFRHGSFSVQSAELTAGLVKLMACALVPIGAVRVMVPTYYAIGDTKTPVVAATVSLLTTVSCGWWLGNQFQIWGLTMATILAASGQVVLLTALLKKRVKAALAKNAATEAGEGSAGKGTGSSMVVHGLKCVLSMVPGALMGLYLSGIRNWFEGHNLSGALWLAGSGALVGGSYIVCAKLLRIEEVDLILGAIFRRLRRRAR